MNQQNMTVLTNIIGAVESGDQHYGKRNYAEYAAPYTNSNIEHTVTLGWAQNYGNEARKLILMILDKMGETEFKKIDKDGSIFNMRFHDWEAERWNPTAAQKKTLVALIDSKAGHECQDELFARLTETFIAECEKTYTKSIPAVMMYCEIRHLGGPEPVKRIFDRLGGDYSLDAIMASLVKDQRDTSNDNQVGDAKFWSRHIKCKTFIEQYAVEEKAEEKEEKKVAVHYISNCGGDENGRISGGKAGDQTGKEWCLRAWYNRPWSCVLRHPDATVRRYHADMAEAAAKNDLIGYDQGQRDTFGVQLKAAGDDPAKIKVACEADCSKGVIDITKAIGRKTGRKELQNIQATYTGDMRAAYKTAGYQVLTASKYLTSPDYLLPGDILLNDNHHTATNITKGSKADGSGEVTPSAPDTDQYIVGSGKVTVKHFLVGAEDPQVKTIQRLLNALGYKGKDKKKLTVDGELGANTTYAIAAFQKAVGMKPDNPGTVATLTWEKLLNAD